MFGFHDLNNKLKVLQNYIRKEKKTHKSTRFNSKIRIHFIKCRRKTIRFSSFKL